MSQAMCCKRISDDSSSGILIYYIQAMQYIAMTFIKQNNMRMIRVQITHDCTLGNSLIQFNASTP